MESGILVGTDEELCVTDRFQGRPVLPLAVQTQCRHDRDPGPVERWLR